MATPLFLERLFLAFLTDLIGSQTTLVYRQAWLVEQYYNSDSKKRWEAVENVTEKEYYNNNYNIINLQRQQI